MNGYHYYSKWRNKFIGIVSFWIWIQNGIKITVQNIIWPNEHFDPNYRFRSLTCDIYHNVIFSYKFIDRILSYTDEKDFKFYGMSMISNVWPSVNDQTWFWARFDQQFDDTTFIITPLYEKTIALDENNSKYI